MKIALKILGGIGALVVLAILYIQFSYQINFSPDYPVDTELRVEVTPERVEHGKYLAYGPAHCAHCHVPLDQTPRIDAGEDLPMIGGMEFTLPPATLRSTNLTPDPETGIGNLSDGELYRMLRYNLKHDGTATIELMPFSTMSDEDIYSVIAYLRSQPPVVHKVEPTEWHFLGKVIKTVALGPIDDGEIGHAEVPKEVSVAYGEYLAASVANCRGCHTERDLKSGAFIGPEYAGGFVFEPSPETGGWRYISPNITPGGIIQGWDKSTFIARMKEGRRHMTSPMPWGTFSRMDSTDLEAVWMFLQQLPANDTRIEQVAEEPKQE